MNRPVSIAAALVVVVVGVGLLVIHRRRVLVAVRRFLHAESHPVNLAVFRIVLFGLLAFLSWEWWRDGALEPFGELPPALRFPPFGTGWLVEPGWIDPLLTPTAIGVGVLALAVAATAAAVGLATRATTVAAALLSLYVLGVPQLFGKVNHGHHLVWFAFLLAASPCGDALSVDRAVRRWWAKRRGEAVPHLARSRAYGFPLRIAWLLLGLVYLFPGVHKYATNGIKWALSDNLANRVLVHHTVAGQQIPDHVAALEPVLPLFAALALAFELTFILLIFSDRLRPYAVVAMLGFHIGTRVLLRIWFFHLVAMYVVFVDWHDLATRMRARWRGGRADSRAGPRPSVTRPWVASVAAAAVLVTGAVWTGATGRVSGWPFAAYPTFANLQEPVVQDLEIEAAREDGSQERLSIGDLVPWLEPSRLQGMTDSILGTSDPEPRLRALWELVVASRGVDDAGTVESLRFYRVRHDLRSGETRREVVHTFRPA